MADEETSSGETSWYDQAAESVQPAYESTTETVQQAYDSTVETVQEAYDWTADTAQEAYESAEETAQRMWSATDDGQLLTDDISMHAGPDVLPWPTQGGRPPTHYVMREGQMTAQGQITKEWLRAQGYQPTGGNLWQHPVTGDSVDLFPPKQHPVEEEQPEESPSSGRDNAEAARGWADYLEQQANALPAELSRCEELVGQPDYAECWNGLVAAWNTLDNDLMTVHGSADGWRAAASDEERVDLEAQIDRTERTQQWREGYSGEFWSRLGQLPQP